MTNAVCLSLSSPPSLLTMPISLMIATRTMERPELHYCIHVSIVMLLSFVVDSGLVQVLHAQCMTDYPSKILNS